MLDALSLGSLDELVERAIPADILALDFKPTKVLTGFTEEQLLKEIEEIINANKNVRSFIGLGFYSSYTPAVIQRHILENPGWYTPYTPYQAEISQGRLEALFIFQTLVKELTGLPIANASLLDEGSAAAEAFQVIINYAAKKKKKGGKVLVSKNIFPTTLSVLKTRANALKDVFPVDLIVQDIEKFCIDEETLGAIIQCPDSYGNVFSYSDLAKEVKDVGGLFCTATDPMWLVLSKSPAQLGADIAFGSMQRFGLPLGFGGPHPAFFAVAEELKRLLPGRLVGLSRDRLGNKAFRLALQTREQHIRREKATSNICTAQVLPAVISAMYAVYYGFEGLKEIASNIHFWASTFYTVLKENGIQLLADSFFDTVVFRAPSEHKVEKIFTELTKRGFYLRRVNSSTLA
ncbi:MAG: glycine dehydrogenase (aminomethyl-transferring), partial [Candidatus Dadabacteria bacterium]